MRIFVYECVSAGALGSAASPSLRREGWAMLSAVVADFGRVATTVTLLDEARSLGDECVPCRDEEQQFRELAARCDFTLVIAPESDGWLFRRSQAVLEVGGRLLGSSPDAIALAGDKLALADHWHANGVPHPATSLLRSLTRKRGCTRTIEIPATFPSLIKPRFGAGSQATYLIANSSSASTCLNAAMEEWPDDLIVQPFVSGEPASVSLLIGTETLPLLPARQHLSNDGRFRYLGGSLPLPEPRARRAVALARRAVASTPGLGGYVGVDVVLGEVDWAIEINPRLTTSYIGLRQLCENNLAELMLDAVEGKTITPPRWSAAEVRFDA